MSQAKEPQHYPYPPNYQYHAPVSGDDEIDLKELFVAVWQGKWIILLTTIVFAAGGVMFALSQPNTYQSSAKLASASSDGGSGIAGMAAQFGGLASLAGINLGGGKTDSKAMALAVLNSRRFINAFIVRHDLLVPLMAGSGWNKTSGELIINEEIYDVAAKAWLRDVEPGESAVPSAWEAHKAFKSLLSVSEEKDTGLVTVSVTHLSPIVAQQWVAWLIQDLNVWMKEQSLEKTKRNIAYIAKQLDKTHVEDMRSVFYQLIEEQTKNLMLAEVEEEFAFQTIDPAVIPEEKVGPKRALICVLATLLGGMLGVTLVLLRMVFKKNKSVELEPAQV